MHWHDPCSSPVHVHVCVCVHACRWLLHVRVGNCADTSVSTNWAKSINFTRFVMRTSIYEFIFDFYMVTFMSCAFCSLLLTCTYCFQVQVCVVSTSRLGLCWLTYEHGHTTDWPCKNRYSAIPVWSKKHVHTVIHLPSAM